MKLFFDVIVPRYFGENKETFSTQENTVWELQEKIDASVSVETQAQRSIDRWS